ncbi:MAG: integrase arm-type DNA-binding domain-containing protein [Oxalobacteraceae bacterium]|nr:integrase arm-type DNA-binding domain-containing protein [Oxalobacteraceae bacterium]
MPKLVVPLTDKHPLNANPKDKPYKLSDGGGLYLLINPDGAKYWRMDYRIFNTRRTAAFGKYPQVSLLEAREKRGAARRLIDDGIDPVQAKQDAARLVADSAAHTFGNLAREWHANKLPTWGASTAANIWRRLELDIIPEIGAMPIGSITHQHMIAALRKIEKRGALRGFFTPKQQSDNARRQNICRDAGTDRKTVVSH